MTPVASPTPTHAQAQRAEDQTSSGGTCCNFFLPTRSPHEGSHVRRGSPDTTILKNMGRGLALVGSLTVGQKCRQGAREPMGGVVHNETLRRSKMFFLVQKLPTTLLQASQVATEACEQ